MTDETLSIKAKGLYAYFCSYCGGGDCAFPRKDNILFHLHISEPTYYKILNQLKDAGYLDIHQRKDNGRFGVNDYVLNETKAQPSPLPKNWDIENGDMEKWDTRNADDTISNNSISINSPSNISPSSTTDGPTELEKLIEELMGELCKKAPRKNQEVAIAARQYLLSVLEGKETGDPLASLHEEFLQHLREGLRGKHVRNLRAYCRAALYNWLAEEPMKSAVRRQTPAPKNSASYDLEALEWLFSHGDLSATPCGL
jgi:hypothetical protein